MNELLDFQRTHVDHLGQPLVADGVDGPRTQWARAFAGLHDDQQRILYEARSHLGHSEQPPGSNRSALIDEWLWRCGVPTGSPWCAAFVSWCLSEVRNVRMASALGFGRAGLFETFKPAAGDVFAFPTDDAGHGHCGLVCGVAAASVMTYEGNVDSQVRCLRRLTAGLRFWRLARVGGGPPPPVILKQPFRAQVIAGTR